MTQFRYEATDAAGASFAGRLDAPSLREAVAELQKRGWNVRRIELAGRESPAEVEKFVQPVSSEAAADIAEMVHEAIRSELPLEPALRAAAEEAPCKEARLMRRLADEIASGTPPDEALAKFGDALPLELSAIVQAGRETGQLLPLLTRYVSLLRQRGGDRGDLVVVMSYPLLLAIGLAAIILFVILVIAPGGAAMLEDFGTDLPWFSVPLLWVSHLVWDHPIWVVVGILVFVSVVTAFFIMLWRKGFGIRSIAPIDWLLRASEWSRFCGLLSLLVEARQPLPRALRAVSHSVSSRRVQVLSETMAAGVESGLSPWEASHQAGIPGPIRYALRWANEPTLLVEALDGLAEVYSRQSRRIIRLLPLLLEPALLFGIAVVLGYVVLALYGPVISLLSAMS